MNKYIITSTASLLALNLLSSCGEKKEEAAPEPEAVIETVNLHKEKL